MVCSRKLRGGAADSATARWQNSIAASGFIGIALGSLSHSRAKCAALYCKIKPMRAFVTGATGLLGNNIVRQLLAAGNEVRGLVRSVEKARRVFPKEDVELVTGDMSDIAGFAGAMKGCDVLFHTAAYFREYYQPGDHKAILEKINVQGTID